MKRRNIIIVCLVAVVGIIAVWVVAANSGTGSLKQNFHIDDTHSITKVFLADKQDRTVLLTKPDVAVDTVWLVNEQYVASQPMVDQLLNTLHDMRIREVVNKSAVDNVLKTLSARGVKVEVYQKSPRINWFGGRLRLFSRERKVATYYVGSETSDLLASYMYREGDKIPYAIHIPGFRGMLTPKFPTDAYVWRSHRIVSYPVQKIARVELEISEKAEESFAVVREGSGFRLELLHPQHFVEGYDTLRVAQMLSSFTNLNFDEYARLVPQVELDTTFSKPPRTTLSITSTDGETHVVRTYIKYANPEDAKVMPDTNLYQVFDMNRLYAIVDNKDTVLIQYYTFDNILQPASFFLGQQKTTIAK